VKPETDRLLEKSARSISAAEALLADGFEEFAAARAYYGMFYAAQAPLSELGLIYHKHGSVHALFGQHFVRPRLLDPKYHRWLLDAYDVRIQGDYGIDAPISAARVQLIIDQAKEFLAEVRRYLASP